MSKEKRTSEGDIPVEIRRRGSTPPHLRDFSITHYWKRFWIAYLCARHGGSTGRKAAAVLEVLWSFARGAEGALRCWPSLNRIARSYGYSDYRALTGRPEHGQKSRRTATDNVLDILVAENLLTYWQEPGTTRQPRYIFEVEDVPPPLTPEQLKLLCWDLREAHGREMSGWVTYYQAMSQIPGETPGTPDQIPGETPGTPDQIPGETPGTPDQIPGETPGTPDGYPAKRRASTRRDAGLIPGETPGEVVPNFTTGTELDTFTATVLTALRVVMPAGWEPNDQDRADAAYLAAAGYSAQQVVDKIQSIGGRRSFQIKRDADEILGLSYFRRAIEQDLEPALVLSDSTVAAADGATARPVLLPATPASALLLPSDVQPRDDLWSETLSQLQLQTTRTDYNTWIRGRTRLGERNGAWVVVADTVDSRDWLLHRLSNLVVWTLTGLTGESRPLEIVIAAG